MQIARCTRAVMRLVLPAALLAALLAPIGCGGSERVKHKKITGVDQPAENRPANPHDEP